MSENDSPKDTPTGTLRRVLLELGPPKSAHLMTWTRAGKQILLEIGYFDLHAIHQQRQPEFDGERVLEWFVTDRFIVDLQTAERITESFAQLGKHLAELREETGATDGTTDGQQ